MTQQSSGRKLVPSQVVRSERNGDAPWLLKPFVNGTPPVLRLPVANAAKMKRRKERFSTSMHVESKKRGLVALTLKSQLGLSGAHVIPMPKSAAGTTAIANMVRHLQKERFSRGAGAWSSCSNLPCSQTCVHSGCKSKPVTLPSLCVLVRQNDVTDPGLQSFADSSIQGGHA
jgi:hypothetical protein